MGVYAPAAAGPLRQGEILSGFQQHVLNIDKLKVGEVVLDSITHPLVIVLAQDCDLEQDYNRRRDGKTDQLSASVLFCAVDSADKVRGRSDLNTKEWKVATQNTNPRYHYLRDVLPTEDAAGQGLAPMAIDFKEYFALPTSEAYYWAEHATRRTRLESPYVEHLCTRFAWYISRVALPIDHHAELPEGHTGGSLLPRDASPTDRPTAGSLKRLTARLARWLLALAHK